MVRNRLIWTSFLWYWAGNREQSSGYFLLYLALIVKQIFTKLLVYYQSRQDLYTVPTFCPAAWEISQSLKNRQHLFNRSCYLTGFRSSESGLHHLVFRRQHSGAVVSNGASQQEGSGFGWSLSVRSLYFLPEPAWVFSGYQLSPTVQRHAG